MFCISMAMVIGPTPPGTGVMKPATSLASLKLTSPTRRCPLFLVASGTELMPTSMMAAPGLTQSPRTNSVLPMAAIRISAWRTTAAMSLVREWQTVTVAFLPISNSAAGIPTMFERPSTTALAPSILTPACSSR